MSIKRLGVVICTLVAAAGLYASALSAGNVPRMGDQRVGIFACAYPGPCAPITLEADEAFHVAHGMGDESWNDLLNPLTRFELTVDGVQVHGAIDLDKGDPDSLSSKVFVFNFPQGMTGTHSFTGCWYRPAGLDACGTRIVNFT